MLSYATLMKQMGVDYKSHNMIALCGIYKPRENLAESKIPVALQQHFNELPYTNTVCLHLDNDGLGSWQPGHCPWFFKKTAIRYITSRRRRL